MLEVRNVSLTMDGLKVINDVTLEVGSNECVVLLGPSGAGKSTLLNIVAGLLRPDQGQVSLKGTNVTGMSGQASYMQQKHLLLPWFTLIDNCCLPLTLRGIPRNQARQRVRELLEIFGLAGFEDYYPDALSGGMCQRGALLRTYLNDHPLMLLDEPFASLDALTRRRLQEWLGQIIGHYHLSVLFVTHDIEEALLLGNRIYMLSSLPAQVIREFQVPCSKEERDQVKAEIWNELRLT